MITVIVRCYMLLVLEHICGAPLNFRAKNVLKHSKSNGGADFACPVAGA